MKTEFSTLDIYRALGIERERLREWMKHEYIKPTVSATGQGKKAIFTREDVHGVALFRQLVESGLDRDTAHHFVNFFHQNEKSNSSLRGYMILRLARLNFQDKLGTKPRYTAEFASAKSVFDLIRGGIVSLPTFVDKDWEIVHLVNLITLRMKTDRALAKL